MYHEMLKCSFCLGIGSTCIYTFLLESSDSVEGGAGHLFTHPLKTQSMPLGKLKHQLKIEQHH